LKLERINIVENETTEPGRKIIKGKNPPKNDSNFGMVNKPIAPKKTPTTPTRNSNIMNLPFSKYRYVLHCSEQLA
jgi:hypothetical protein